MQIWVDADACPRPIKDILFRAAMKREIRITLVANQYLSTPRSPFIKSLQVPAGFDVADNEIVKRTAPGDLVITSDIPLAAEVVQKGSHCISPRGDVFTPDNMAERLQLRNLTTTLRDSGMIEGGRQAGFGNADKAAFANAFDRLLAGRNNA